MPDSAPRRERVIRLSSQDDREADHRVIRQAFRQACKAAGVACGLDGGIVIHDLRRSAITEARRAGIPESVVMRMSGHKTRAVFDRYNIVEEDDLKQAVQKLQDHRAGRDLVEAKKAAPG